MVRLLRITGAPAGREGHKGQPTLEAARWNEPFASAVERERIGSAVMRHMVNGMEVDLPVDVAGQVDSDVVREMVGIEPDRPLALKRSDGSNEIINPGEKVRVRPGEHFEDLPVHKRG